jgi:hypothetical protein
MMRSHAAALLDGPTPEATARERRVELLIVSDRVERLANEPDELDAAIYGGPAVHWSKEAGR